MKTVGDIVGDRDDVALYGEAQDVRISAIHADSRRVDRGSLFVAMRGAEFDGHQFIGDAIDAGAAAVVMERGAGENPEGLSVPAVVVDDARRVLGEFAAQFYEHPSRELTVIGVTGTNGKTTSSYLLESIFDAASLSTGIIGTIEYRWNDRRVAASNTTPDGLTLQRTLRAMVDDGVDIAVIEVSSHGLELGRVANTAFDMAVFTNLSRDHIDFHGSMDAYRRAKWRLFTEFLPHCRATHGNPGTAIINIVDGEGRTLANALRGCDDVQVFTHAVDGDDGAKNRADFRGRAVTFDLRGISMEVVEGHDKQFLVESPLPGRFNAENILGVVAAARRCGVDTEAIARGLADSRGVPGRMERVGNRSIGPAVFVDYAHTPDALYQALQTLRPLTSQRLWVVVGCGGDRERSKRGPMGSVAVSYADRVIFTSDNPRSEKPQAIIDDIVDGLDEVGDHGSEIWSICIERAEAIGNAILRATPRDVILIAGKGHETYQEIDGRRCDFDDREVASKALRRRGA